MTKTVAGSPSVFTPEMTATINRAYAEACDIIAAEANAERLRPELARCMMDLARNGEKDEGRLCSLSVLAVLGSRSRTNR